MKDDLADWISRATMAALELGPLWLGDRLGLYAALADVPDASPAELASAAGIAERYAREWLEQQAVAGIVDVSVPGRDPAARRYRLPEAHADVLLNVESLSHSMPNTLGTIGTLRALPLIRDAFASGRGVPYAAYAEGIEDSIGGENRPVFTQRLATVWLPAVPGVADRLTAEPPAAVADLGCGAGWSSIAIARGFPAARVSGFDPDPASIERARHNAAEAGVAGRVSFHCADAGTLGGPYDLVTAFECVHDMPDPVSVLRAARAGLAPGGIMVIGDEPVADEFIAPGDDNERLHYAWSVMQCLPASLHTQPSAALGAVLRPDRMRSLAGEAGFAGIEIVPIDDDAFRFYRLTA